MWLTLVHLPCARVLTLPTTCVLQSEVEASSDTAKDVERGTGLDDGCGDTPSQPTRIGRSKRKMALSW